MKIFLGEFLKAQIFLIIFIILQFTIPELLQLFVHANFYSIKIIEEFKCILNFNLISSIEISILIFSFFSIFITFISCYFKIKRSLFFIPTLLFLIFHYFIILRDTSGCASLYFLPISLLNVSFLFHTIFILKKIKNRENLILPISLFFLYPICIFIQFGIVLKLAPMIENCFTGECLGALI